jgi:hypothetical protein
MKRSGAFCGIAAVALSTAISVFWTYWGTIENFHEGWYSRSLLGNIGLALVQYVGFPIVFMTLAALSIWKPKLGAAVFLAIGIGLNAFLFGFRNAVGIVLFLVPCAILAALFWFASFRRPRAALAVSLLPPLLLMLAIAVPLGWKVSHRLELQGNEALISGGLMWAPPGPGWPERGMSYQAAMERCAHLDASGREVVKERLGLWRLPTAEEAVAALNRGGSPAGCRFSGSEGFQRCDREPDKEAPLWDPHTMVIYWWTGSINESGKDMRVAYNGYVLPVSVKGAGGDYVGFRAVRSVDARPVTSTGDRGVSDMSKGSRP